MGFKQSWNVTEMASQINTMTYEIKSGYNDGFLSWGIKQDLYRLKWILDDALRRCPTFAPEDDWLREQEKKKIINILSKNETNL